MALSKKYYDIFAKIIGNAYLNDSLNVVTDLEEELITFFQKDNPNFDERLFKRAVTKIIQEGH